MTLLNFETTHKFTINALWLKGHAQAHSNISHGSGCSNLRCAVKNPDQFQVENEQDRSTLNDFCRFQLLTTRKCVGY